jgi:hypothetical protein
MRHFRARLSKKNKKSAAQSILQRAYVRRSTTFYYLNVQIAALPDMKNPLKKPSGMKLASIPL